MRAIRMRSLATRYNEACCPTKLKGSENGAKPRRLAFIAHGFAAALRLFESAEWHDRIEAPNRARPWLPSELYKALRCLQKLRSKPMRKSSLLTAAAFIVSIAASTSAMATNFSGIPPMPGQQDYVPPASAQQKLSQYPADPAFQLRRDHQQTSPYDSPDFVVPPYEIQ
jgi:hypothetical protein